MDWQHLLVKMLQEGHAPSHRQLQALSNLGAEELRAFRQAWPAAPIERRRQIARAIALLSEDSTDMNFSDVLLICLDDPDETVRSAAIEGLGDNQDSAFLERLLVLAAQDPSPAVRSQAILALGDFMHLIETTDLLGDYRQRLLQLLLEVFHDPHAPLEVRRRALESMSYVGNSAEVEHAIVQAYRAPQREMHASAIHAMGHTMGERWLSSIERELASPDPEMRYEAAHAVGEMNDPALVALLEPLLDDDDHEVVREALWALGEIGGSKARRLLERCLAREDEDIREAAEKALETLEFYEDPMGVL